MAFRVCCSCNANRNVTWRRWMQFSEVLAGNERTTDTTDWVTNTAFQEFGLCSPLTYSEYDTSIWMKPLRFTLLGTTQGEDNASGHDLYDERTLNTITGASVNASQKHTYSIMANAAAGVPTGSHLGSVRLNEWTWKPSIWQNWWSFEPSHTSAESLTTVYRGYLEAYRLRIDAVDVTGIVTLGTEIGFWSVAQLEHGTLLNGNQWFFLNNTIGQASLSKALSDTSTWEIDLWFRVDIEGWHDYYAPGTSPSGPADGNTAYSAAAGRIPVISLGDITVDALSTTASILNKTYGALGNQSIYGNTNQRLLLAPQYYFDLSLIGKSAKMPRGFPWTLTFEDSSWTPGGVSDFDMSNPPATSTYKMRLYPTFSESVSPDNAWDDSTYTKIDEQILQPTAGDGTVASHGPHTIISPETAEARWRCSTTDTIATPITKVTIWYYANCDSNSDGNITSVKFLYTVSGTEYTRTATPSSLTSTRSWRSVEFTGSDIAGLSATSNPKAQVSATLSTSDAFVELDALYIEYDIAGDWTIETTETTFYAVHDNGDAISFQFGREVPELIMKKNSNTRTSNGTLIGSAVHCLYRPADNDKYQSDVIIATESIIEPAGTWNPSNDAVFKICGYGPSTRAYEAVSNTGAYDGFQTNDALLATFPPTITLVKN